MLNREYIKKKKKKTLIPKLTNHQSMLNQPTKPSIHLENIIQNYDLSMVYVSLSHTHTHI